MFRIGAFGSLLCGFLTVYCAHSGGRGIVLAAFLTGVCFTATYLFYGDDSLGHDA